MIKFNNEKIDFIEYLNSLINKVYEDKNAFIATIDEDLTDGKITHLNININRDYRGFNDEDDE